MKLKQFLEVHLSLLAFANVIYGFSINAGDKIAVESGTQVVSDKRVYLPLGWPAAIPCDSVSKLKGMNIEQPGRLKWIIRFANNSNLLLEPSGKKTYDFDPDSLNLNPVVWEIDGSVIECIMDRPGNTSLVSRNRVEVQDCRPQPPEDQKAYNLHNPCAYGKCQVVDRNSTVECLCFKQYTGRHCDIRKPYSWTFDVFPYVTAILVIVIHFIVNSTVSLMDDERKQEQVMGIAELSGRADREIFNFSYLFPFMKKLRRCNYSDLDGTGYKNRKFRKLQKKVIKMRDKTETANFKPTPAPGAKKPQVLTSTISKLPPMTATTGATTGGTTGANTTTTTRLNTTGTTGGPPGSTMRTVTLSGGPTAPSTRTDVTYTGALQKAPMKVVNDKKQVPKQQPKPQKQSKKKETAASKSAEKPFEPIDDNEGYNMDDSISGSLL